LRSDLFLMPIESGKIIDTNGNVFGNDNDQQL